MEKVGLAFTVELATGLVDGFKIQGVETLILDVGCGTSPHGDVNVDLHPEATMHRSRTQAKMRPINTATTPNFVKADAHYLPFRSNSFHTVVSHHTIEHVGNPVAMLKEMLRIAKRTVVVVCPHRFAERAGVVKAHKHFFNKRWFVGVLRALNVPVFEVNYTLWRCFPHVSVPIVRFPREMSIKILKPWGLGEKQNA